MGRGAERAAIGIPAANHPHRKREHQVQRRERTPPGLEATTRTIQARTRQQLAADETEPLAQVVASTLGLEATPGREVRTLQPAVRRASDRIVEIVQAQEALARAVPVSSEVACRGARELAVPARRCQARHVRVVSGEQRGGGGGLPLRHACNAPNSLNARGGLHLDRFGEACQQLGRAGLARHQLE